MNKRVAMKNVFPVLKKLNDRLTMLLNKTLSSDLCEELQFLLVDFEMYCHLTCMSLLRDYKKLKGKR